MSSDLTRSNYSANSVLTSTALNADFNQILTRINDFPGDQLTASTVPRTALASGAVAKLIIASKTTTYTATSSDDVILCDTSAEDWTLTLPASAGIDGKIYWIKKTTTDAYTLTIDGNSSETIDGLTTIKLYGQYDFVKIVSDGTNWVILAKKITSIVRLHTGNGHGSSSTKIRRFTTTVLNVGNDITYADSSTLGGTFTINADGIYAITFTDQAGGGGAAQMGISLNSAELTTNVYNITIATRLAYTKIPSASEVGTASWTGRLVANDVIRAHTEAAQADTRTAFTITRIA